MYGHLVFVLCKRRTHDKDLNNNFKAVGQCYSEYKKKMNEPHKIWIMFLTGINKKRNGNRVCIKETFFQQFASKYTIILLHPLVEKSAVLLFNVI